MSRSATAAVIATLAAILPLAGCGSSSSSSSTSPSSSSTTSSTAAAPSTSPPPTTGSIPSNNGAATALLPASFVAGADGSLSPRTVAAPAATTILLTVSSHASHPLSIAIAGHSLTVPASGHVSARLAGLKPARYPVAVAGRPRAVIIVGAQAGP
jgi:hypothetical protein